MTPAPLARYLGRKRALGAAVAIAGAVIAALALTASQAGAWRGLGWLGGVLILTGGWEVWRHEQLRRRLGDLLRIDRRVPDAPGRIRIVFGTGPSVDLRPRAREHDAIADALEAMARAPAARVVRDDGPPR